jgi:4'-phosphopantetheinyl transferase
VSGDWQPRVWDAINVALIDLDAPSAAMLDDAALLAREEVERAARFAAEPEARRYRRAHAALRLAVGGEAGVAPAALQFVRGEHGKPHLAGSDIHFNLSHASNWASVAWTRGRDVGIDIELRTRRVVEPLRLAARFLHPEEHARLEALAEENREASFLRLWTAREAYLKAIGTGLGTGGEAFNGVALLDGVQAFDWQGWTVRALAAPAELSAAVAARGGQWGIRPSGLTGRRLG